MDAKIKELNQVVIEGQQGKFQQAGSDVVGMSAVLTITMVNMKSTIDHLSVRGLRNNVEMIIGGAAITHDYEEIIGEDGYAADSSRAVSLGKSLVNN